MIRTAPRSPDSERATVAMAVVVMTICATLATVLVTRNVSQAHRSVLITERAVALEAAELGVAQAQIMIQLGRRSGRYSGEVREGVSWTVEVQPESSDTVLVRSTGTAQGMTQVVEVQMTTQAGQIQVVEWSQAPIGDRDSSSGRHRLRQGQ